MILSTSWDDGHPADEKLAALLEKHGLAGTFFVPMRNCEGRPVLKAASMRRLAEHFEIGSHTLDHVYLDSVHLGEAARQISVGKDALEQLLGQPVEGFCYPGGKITAPLRRLVQETGFHYARTIENFRIEPGADPYQLPTTLQCYPHARHTLILNYFSHGSLGARWPGFSVSLFAMTWGDAARRIADNLTDKDAVLHLWGHSWEIEELGLWDELDKLFDYLESLHPRTLELRDSVKMMLKDPR